MKHFLLFIFFFISIDCFHSQDQLFLKDNTKLSVKIISVGDVEIKFKRFDNLNGPIHVLAKEDVSLIIFENGKHQVINSGLTGSGEKIGPNYHPDSLSFSKYSNTIFLNFINFLDSELGFIYQKKLSKKNIYIILPFSIGIGVPNYTNRRDLRNFYSQYEAGRVLIFNRKVFEVGLGFNYILFTKYQTKGYVGPAIKFMSYDATQTYYYKKDPFSSSRYHDIYETYLNRWTTTITGGLLFGSKNRLTFNLFLSIGAKYDVVTSMATDPITHNQIDPVSKPISTYAWLGACVGLAFH